MNILTVTRITEPQQRLCGTHHEAVHLMGKPGSFSTVNSLQATVKDGP